MQIERKNYSHLPPAGGGFCHAVRANGFLFLSGFTTGNTPAEDGDIVAQTEATLERIGSLLEAEGAGLADIVKVTVYVTEIDRLREVHEVRFRHFGDQVPASTLVQVAGLVRPNLKIEIEAIVASPD